MPKLKTNRAAAKRFKSTARGGYKHGQSHKRHILTKKSSKRKRPLRAPIRCTTMSPASARCFQR